MDFRDIIVSGIKFLIVGGTLTKSSNSLKTKVKGDLALVARSISSNSRRVTRKPCLSSPASRLPADGPSSGSRFNLCKDIYVVFADNSTGYCLLHGIKTKDELIKLVKQCTATLPIYWPDIKWRYLRATMLAKINQRKSMSPSNQWEFKSFQ